MFGLAVFVSLCALTLQGFYPCPPPYIEEPLFLPPPPPIYCEPIYVPPPMPRRAPCRCHRCHCHRPTPATPPKPVRPTVSLTPAPRKPVELRADEVRQVMNTYLKLLDEEGHLTDLFELIDENIVIREGEYTYHGRRGLEDFCRERPLDFIEETRKVLSMDIVIKGEIATVTSVEEWTARTHPGQGFPEPVRAHMTYSWDVKKTSGGKIVILSQTLKDFAFLEI